MQETQSLSQRILGTGLLSACALLLEIVLTRLFSVLYFPPYVFLIISFAILGIGLGAAISAIRPRFATIHHIPLFTTGASLSTALLAIFTVQTTAYDIQVILLILVTIPYIFVGLALSTIFTRHSGASRILYMGDLVGAGIGAIVIIPVMDAFGPLNSILIVSLGFAISGIYFYAKQYALIIFATIAIATIVTGSNLIGNWLQLDMANITTDKPIREILSSGGKIIDTSWDAFARTDLVDPGNNSPLRIYVDGGAASIMPSEEINAGLVQDIGFFPFATEQPEKVFIIGPGAGLDVWFGLQSEAKQIVAVEVNPASVDLVNRYRGLNGGLYTQPAVDIIIDDGRSALMRSESQYDLIYLSQVVTLAAERGGYSLSENTVYTVEAFDDYLSKLSDNGLIALKLYDEITLTRATSIALAALRNQSLSDADALKHLMTFLDSNANPPIPLLLVRKSEFSKDDSLVLGSIAQDVGFTPMYLPYVLVQPPLDQVDQGMVPFQTLIDASDADISPTHDQHPYFFQFEYGIPESLQPITLIMGLVSLGGLALYLFRGLQSSDHLVQSLPPYFVLLGAGFIAIEIYIIQQTRLFLGHPTFAVTLVLATILIGGGIGSGLSQRYIQRNRSLYRVVLLVAIGFVLWNGLWSIFSTQLMAAPLIIRGLLVVALVAPLAIVMGIPFPSGLRLASQSDNRLIAVIWATNGVASVAGTVLSVVLSITIGFQAVAITGTIAYLVAGFILFQLRTLPNPES